MKISYVHSVRQKILYSTLLYSPRQKSWPVIHKFNEKSYKQCQKCLLLADMYRGHKQYWYLFIPPS